MLRPFVFALTGVFLGLSSASAATLQVTFANETPSHTFFADYTTLTFRFATAVDNSTSFTFTDLHDRIWHRPDLIGQGTGYLGTFGVYPVANVTGTTFSSTGMTFNTLGNITGGVFDFVETKPANGPTPAFKPINLDYYTAGDNFTVWALWTAGNGGPFRFSKASYSYDPTGRAADFAAPTSPVPLPASAWLLGTAVVGLAARRRFTRRPA